jgi:cell division protein ZapE
MTTPMTTRETLTALHDREVAAGLRRDDPGQREVLAILQSLRDRLERPGFTRRRAGGLYLWGGVGRGKSMMMDLFVQATDVAGKRRVHFDAFLRDIHAAVHRARGQGVPDPLAHVIADIARGLRLLALDEMQVSDIADATILHRVFQGLFAAGTVVVTTSNRPPQELYRDGIKRELFLPFIDLLTGTLTVHHLPGDTDFRRGRPPGAQVYFTPDDVAATAALDRIWHDLTAGQAAPLALRVQGRDLVLPAYRDRMARMTFDHACGTPRSAAEYLAIASALRLMVLDNVPRLSHRRHDQARRFVMLVDALYDARVTLILSAATAPEALYTDGEGAAVFVRTISRLHEMQAEDWAADRT